MVSRLSRFPRAVLHLVTVLSLAYVGYLAVRNFSAISISQLPALTLPVTIGLALVYGAALLLLAENWHRLVGASGAARPRRSRTCRVFTDTQLAKYLPGNVLHIVTRHMHLKDQKLTHGQLAKAFVLETVALIIGAGLFAVVVVSFAPPSAGAPAAIWNSAGTLAQGAMVVTVIACCGLGIATLPGKMPAALAVCMIALALTTTFFAVSGG